MGKFYDTVIFFITPDPSWLVALLESLIGTLLYGPNVPYQSLQSCKFLFNWFIMANLWFSDQIWVMPNEKIEFKKSTRTGIERNQSEESMHTTGRTNVSLSLIWFISNSAVVCRWQSAKPPEQISKTMTHYVQWARFKRITAHRNTNLLANRFVRDKCIKLHWLFERIYLRY